MQARFLNLPYKRSTRSRRGGATAGLLAILTTIASMATAALVIGPRFSLGAMSKDAPGPMEKLSERQIFTNQIAGIFGGCHQVLAVHERGATPYLEALLWVEDRINPGQIDPVEVVVISHSRVLQTLIWYALPGTYENATWSDLDNSILTVERINDAVFCERWRSSAHVVPRVVATGLSDLTIKTAHREGSEAGVMQLRVIWPVDSTDSPTETSAHVEAAVGSLSQTRK